MMIDLHTHTFLSDGELVPAEQARRAEVKGYRFLGLADHADLATMGWTIPILLEAAWRENKAGKMTVLAGIELTHVRASQLGEAVEVARDLGAQVIIVHGQTIAEPVEEGTNRAAIEAGADILAHPGLISQADAELAAQKGVLLEISAKAGHSLANGHVTMMARKTGAKLIFGSDAHNSDQMPTLAYAKTICAGAGLTDAEIDRMFRNAETFAVSRAKKAD